MGAGGASKYRHLSRPTAHRKALLRNLVTSLFTHESITTTWPKAKEAQMLAEKLITLGKRNTPAARQRATAVFYTPHELLPKLFGPLRERYAERPGGYTRVLRIEPRANDQAPTAVLELVDGKRDLRFAMTAQTLARMKVLGQRERTSVTEMNVRKVTRFRRDGGIELDRLVGRFEELHLKGVGVGDEGDVGVGHGMREVDHDHDHEHDKDNAKEETPNLTRPLTRKINRYAHTQRPDTLRQNNRMLRSMGKLARNDGDAEMRREGGVDASPF